MAATYGGDTGDIQEQTVKDIYSLYSLQYPSEIQKIFEARLAKIENLDIEMDEVIRKTERTVSGFVTKKREFVYRDGSFVKSNISYHIHYTIDIGEYFMTGEEHNKLSRLIYPLNRYKTDHGHYNTLNKQSQLYVSSQATVPTEDDYVNGSFTRYFAQKANEKQSPVFEVSVDDFGSSPLYEYISLTWYITGEVTQVYAANSLEVMKAQEKLPNVNKILTPFQFYRFVENLSDVDKIKNKLAGMDLSDYNTNTLSDGYSDQTFGGDGSGGLGGTCSLGPQYTTKEACIAAGGSWSESGLLDSDGNYTSAADADGQLYDANGNLITDTDAICKK